MKNLILFLAICLCFNQWNFAQQLPVLNHYIYNPYLYNPARTGQLDYGTVSMHFKKQWVAMPNSPFTGAISLESPIKTEKLGDMGLGGLLYFDQMHIVDKIGGLGTYAYHIPFEKNKEYVHRLSAGMSLGFIYQRFNFPDAIVENLADNQLLPSEGNGVSFDFSAGLDYQWRGLHIGGSMLQGLNTGLQFFNVGDRDVRYVNTRHFMVMASYKHIFSAEDKKHPLYLEPYFLGRIIENVPFQAEGNITVGLDGMGWMGVGYRSSNNATLTSAVNVSLGVEVNRNFVFAYSFEIPVDGNLIANMGTQHEFMLAYRFRENPKIKKMEVLMDSTKIVQQQLVKTISTMEETIKNLADTLHLRIDDHNEKLDEHREDLDEHKQRLDMTDGLIGKNKGEIDELRDMINKQVNKYKKVGEVYFDNGSSSLNAIGNANLDAVYSSISQLESDDNTTVTIYVKGNSSTNGNAKQNLELSMRRATAVRQYLIRKGLDGNKVIIIPMGESDPVSGVDDNKGDSRDRRVDIIFTAVKGN